MAAVIESRTEVGLIRPGSRPRFPGPLLGVSGHHNGPPMGLAGKAHSLCQQAVCNIQRFHMGRNYTPNPLASGRHWEDAAYSAAVCHHEVAMEMRGPGVRTAANGTKAGNDRWYAVLFLVGDGEDPSLEMLSAADHYARERLGTATWNKHSDHKSTSCPGRVSNYISGGRLRLDGSASGGGSNTGGSSMLRRGDKGAAVRTWQRRLLGWDAKALPRFGADSDFGGETEDWTERFQRAAGLSQDGVVGPKTLAAMDEVEASAPKPPAPEPEPGPFTDVPASHQHAEVFARAKALGIIGGYADGSMRPGQPATRGDLALVAVRLHDLLKG